MGSKVSNKCSGLTAAVLVSAFGLTGQAVQAQQVVLSSADGGLNITGDFVDFTNNNYVVQTDMGELRVPSNGVSCEGAACPDLENPTVMVTISGSETMAEGLMPVLLSGYAGFLGAEEAIAQADPFGERVVRMVAEDGFGDPLSNFRVRASISSDAFANLLGKSAQIGLSSRRIAAEEARTLEQRGSGDMRGTANEHIVAIDSLVVITHPDNPVDSLTMDQLRGIYGGSITNWSQVGGNDAEITVVQLLPGSGTRAVFEERVFDGPVPGTPPVQVTADSSSAVSVLVDENENAIGFVSYAFQRDAQPVTLTNECGIEMIPDAFSARTEEYALQRFLYLYSRSDAAVPEARDFLQYVTSEDADQLIAKAGFIDLGIARRAQSLDSARSRQLLDPNADVNELVVMRDMMVEMLEHDRLSSTFRFETGSRNLTPRGLLNLERLADYLSEQPDGTKILLAGFTDSVGAFANNRDLAVSRAQQVSEALRRVGRDRLDGIDIEIAGFGEVAPTACNETEDGRRINRRVEVWIQDA